MPIDFEEYTNVPVWRHPRAAIHVEKTKMDDRLLPQIAVNALEGGFFLKQRSTEDRSFDVAQYR